MSHMFTGLWFACLLVASTPARDACAQAAPTQYTLVIHETRNDLAGRHDPARGDAYWSAFTALAGEMQQAGVLRGGTALGGDAPVRSVSVRRGRIESAATSRAASPLVLSGYLIIEVASLDEAVAWAAKVPAALHGIVEVREHQANPMMGH